MMPRNNYTVNDYFNKFENIGTGNNSYMRADIMEQNDRYYIVIDVPGVNRNNLFIDYENGYLNIKAIKVDTTGISYVRRERFVGEVRRSFYIGFKRYEDIKAQYKDGVLEVSFPKQELPKKDSRNINIG